MTLIEVLSPEGGAPHTEALDAPRLPDVRGTLIGLHDNAKPGAAELLRAIGLGQIERGDQLRSWTKAHAARPSPHIIELGAPVRGAVFVLGD